MREASPSGLQSSFFLRVRFSNNYDRHTYTIHPDPKSPLCSLSPGMSSATCDDPPIDTYAFIFSRGRISPRCGTPVISVNGLVSAMQIKFDDLAITEDTEWMVQDGNSYSVVVISSVTGIRASVTHAWRLRVNGTETEFSHAAHSDLQPGDVIDLEYVRRTNLAYTRTLNAPGSSLDFSDNKSSIDFLLKSSANHTSSSTGSGDDSEDSRPISDYSRVTTRLSSQRKASGGFIVYRTVSADSLVSLS